MKSLLVNVFVALLHQIRKLIALIAHHAIPSTRLHSPSSAFHYFREDEIRDSYTHFKQYFYNAIFLDGKQLRHYAITRAHQVHQPQYSYLEFGVWKGRTLNQFAKVLTDIPIYGFDSFQGINEDWVGTDAPKGQFNLNSKIPKLRNNCVPIVGVIQKTLPQFISDSKDLEINFIHIDTDTYPTAKFILGQVKPYLVDQCIIVFDELYDFEGWSVGEYKALTEVFTEDEYEFLAFSKDEGNAALRFKKL
ncbi:MAG: class I SAM-dependent methyltransferase [Acidimicrobiales bacterium]|nr:class I SAM-dependent methyltransferase [Acidimicrobiales bacterium]